MHLLKSKRILGITVLISLKVNNFFSYNNDQNLKCYFAYKCDQREYNARHVAKGYNQ
jgi:hypothetical protein